MIGIKVNKDDDYVVTFTGKHAVASVVNGLRRIIMGEIPSYAFHSDNFSIRENTSIYNNTMMKKTLQCLIIPSINNNIHIIDTSRVILPSSYATANLQLYKNDASVDTMVNDPKNDEEYQKKIIISLNVTNETKQNVTYTTHDCELIINGKSSGNFTASNPQPIITLRPDEKFDFDAFATLGIHKFHAIFNICVIYRYEELKENEWVLGFRGIGQSSSDFIFMKACSIMIKKLTIIRDHIKSLGSSGNNIRIEIHSESHTIGNLVTSIAKMHNKISYAGYKSPQLTECLFMEFHAENPKDEIQPLIEDVMNTCIDIYNRIIMDL